MVLRHVIFSKVSLSLTHFSSGLGTRWTQLKLWSKQTRKKLGWTELFGDDEKNTTPNKRPTHRPTRPSPPNSVEDGGDAHPTRRTTTGPSDRRDGASAPRSGASRGLGRSPAISRLVGSPWTASRYQSVDPRIDCTGCSCRSHSKSGAEVGVEGGGAERMMCLVDGSPRNPKFFSTGPGSEGVPVDHKSCRQDGSNPIRSVDRSPS